MPHQNYDQVRAKHALDFARNVAEGRVNASGKEGGDAMRKIPAMIMANGLLAAIAFAIEQKKDRQTGQMEPRSKGHCAIFDAIAGHLAADPIGVTPGVTDARSLIDHLVEADSQTLKLATDEALAWLSYARRFVSGGDGEGNEAGEPAE
ncbi:MAG: type III-B CRISPR module-associated protein Cmr5 [Verrucomicrobiales bacterium]|nr:type III-B CRISPR module-associated protein Cmr5 [Verrucomicrobiales bacterium]MCP5525936.1 type III-B CRISPR module-associated protein Cmr5 [Verrucomicrobiales bacterium]